MMDLQTFPDSGAAVPAAPIDSRSDSRGVAVFAADEPDRAGMLIAVSFALITLLSVTLALAYAIIFS